MRHPILLMLLLALLPPHPVRAAETSAANAMADAMERMMEAMGMLDDDDGAAMPAMPQGMPGMPGMGPMGYGQWWPGGQVPGYGVFSDPIQAFGMSGLSEQMAGQMPSQMPGQGWGGAGWPWGVAGSEPLDGVWEGRDGGLLIVRGKRFRLQAGHGGHVEGFIRREGERLAMYEPSTGSVRVYDLAISQGRMVLRDTAGTTYLYRRLWLDKRSGAGFSMDPMTRRNPGGSAQE